MIEFIKILESQGVFWALYPHGFKRKVGITEARKMVDQGRAVWWSDADDDAPEDEEDAA